MLNNLRPLEATNLEIELKKWLPENYYGLATNFHGQFLIFFGAIPNFRVFQGLFQGYLPFLGYFRVFRGRWPPCMSFIVKSVL